MAEPSLLDLQKCIHCGLCLQSCPTFLSTGSEADSPRGRIYLMRAAVEGRMDWSQVQPHIDRCMGCLSCQTACPSGVPYAKLLESARAQVEEEARSGSEALWRRLALTAFTRPGLLHFGLVAARTLGIKRPPRFLARKLGAAEVKMRLPRLPEYRWRPRSVYPAIGEARGRVALLKGCAMSALFPQVHRATVAVLRQNGFEVCVPKRQGCCGALWAHNGYPDRAKKAALQLARRFAEHDYVIVNSAGCGSAMKEHASLWPDGRAPDEVVRLAQKTKDITEFLVEQGFKPGVLLNPLAAGYHDACHLSHGQGIRNQPREMLRSIQGLTLLEIPEICCGSAGIYNLLQPELATDALKSKVRSILDSGAQAVVSANPGCTLWIAQGLAQAKRPLPILHPIELLAQAYTVE